MDYLGFRGFELLVYMRERWRRLCVSSRESEVVQSRKWKRGCGCTGVRLLCVYDFVVGSNGTIG